MFDYQVTIDALTQWGGFLRNHVPVERWPNPVLWSGVAVLAGLVLAFWGARLLRTIYVLMFMVMGGLVGVRLAGAGQVDLLIGLTLGAGLGALLAAALFRFWVGLTTGTVAVLVLVLAGSPRLNQEFLSFNDFRQGVGSGDWSTSLRPPEPPKLDSWEQTRAYAAEFKNYLLSHRQDALVRSGVALGLVWLLGTAAGWLLPRVTMVFGTSVFGIVLLGGGAGVLLSTRWPAVWNSIIQNRSWFLAGLAVLFLAALSYQARNRRIPTIPVPTAPATPRPV